MHSLLVILSFAMFCRFSSALNCGPDMLTFQDITPSAFLKSNAVSSSSSSDAIVNNVGGIVCVFVTDGSTPRIAFYGEGRLTNGREYRYLGQASAFDSKNSIESTDSTNAQISQPIISIGGYSIESTLYGSFAGTSTHNNSISSINNQISLTVSSDRIIVTDGSSTRTWLLKSDVPNYQPLDLPLSCGSALQAFKVRYPPGVAVPHPSIGLRCVMPHSGKFMTTYLAVGDINQHPYMYLATRGLGGKWGRRGICWHNKYLLDSGKCPKSDFGSFVIKPVDFKSGTSDINNEVQQGLRELWIPKVSKSSQNNNSGSEIVSSQQSDESDLLRY